MNNKKHNLVIMFLVMVTILTPTTPIFASTHNTSAGIRHKGNQPTSRKKVSTTKTNINKITPSTYRRNQTATSSATEKVSNVGFF